MADATLQVLLDKGMNTVTPAFLTEPGTLMDCLNYEMDSDVGYRRIDGYEAYDGWLGGDINEYYRVDVNLDDPTVIASLVAGQMLGDTSNDSNVAIVLVYHPTGTNVGVLTYAAVNNEAPIIPSGMTLGTSRTGATRLTATSTAVKGSVVDNASVHAVDMRSASSTLRALVTPFTRPVAGLHWSRNNLIAAVDTPVISMTGTYSGFANGAIIGLNGVAYRILEVVAVAGAPGSTTLYVETLTGSTPAAGTPCLCAEFTTASNTYPVLTVIGGLGTPTVSTTSASRQASMYACYTPETSDTRGYRLMTRSLFVQFSNATAAAEAEWIGNITPGDDTTTSYAVKLGPNNTSVIFYTIRNCWVTSGSFAAGNASGWLELYSVSQPTTVGATPIGNIDPATFDLWGGEFSPYTKRADITSFFWSTVAGTLALREAGTRYVAENYNFYGQWYSQESYGATGASRAFWAQAWRDSYLKPNPLGVVSTYDNYRFVWGNILTDTTASRDKPKYLAYHSGRLALGHSGGSVVLSLPGEPGIFDGVLGGMEIATGDNITGLLEIQGDSLAVFGKKSIRRITGTVDADIDIQTISANAGAYNYTCVSVGSTPVFTGSNGISTLQQATEYGDFKGQRVSDAVGNTLVPRLLIDWTDSQAGGVAMALPVRNKNQYRLWLSTGECYTVTFTSNGPRIMKSNYATYSAGNPDTLNVPFAWSSGLTDNLKEHIHVVWDSTLASRYVNATGTVATAPSAVQVYELDRGWGFNGVTFDSYFEVAHLFPTQGSMFTTVEKVRLYGMSHGLATINVRTSSIEDDFDQDYHSATQDISLPATPNSYFYNMHPMTSIIDQANWGLGVKLKIGSTTAKGSTSTEPPHICQVMTLYVKSQGALDG